MGFQLAGDGSMFTALGRAVYANPIAQGSAPHAQAHQ